MRMMLLTLVISFAVAGLGCDKGGGGTTATPEDSIGDESECTPDCDGKQCGEDGCEGTCGECQGDDTCTLGVCTSPAPICGNEVCEPPEGPEDCPEDCTGLDDCGDDDCVPPETAETCPADCAPVEPICGNDVCEPPEGPEDCPEDCTGLDGCGDETCTPPETPETCPADCAPEDDCGDEICTPPETHDTCPEDCEEPIEPQTCTEDADCVAPACPEEAPKGCVCVPGPDDEGICIPACETDEDCPTPPGIPLECGPDGYCVGGGEDPECGDHVCTPPENPETCPEDCTMDPECGDQICTPPETPESCPGDCAGAAECGDEICTAPETPETCPQDCADEAECGDEICTPPETPESCPGDCGGPPTCTEDADCGGPACPAEATKGCVCMTGPDGGVCMPACDTDADCPSPPDFPLVCGPDGVCMGEGGEAECGDEICTPPETPESCPGDCAGGPQNCTVDADCTGPACPLDATKGCVCAIGPDGGVCMHACDTDADCPSPPDFPLECGPDGYCIGGGGGGDCGDEICTPPETPESCPGDCGGGQPDFCAEDADCVEPNCPPDATMGCVCIDGPGGGWCVPACSTDADCSSLQGGPFVCSDEGFCNPEGEGPQSCGTDADCAQPGQCLPEFTLGCVCAEEEPGDFKCLPACVTDDDCPTFGNDVLTCEPEGYCAK